MRTAEHDPYTPPMHADLVLKHITNASQISHGMVKNAGHFSFLSPFPTSMTHPGFLPATDPNGFDRAEFHKLLNQDILTFLDKALLKATS